MANVSNVITLGIGTPGSIKYFVTVGLGIKAPSAPPARTYAVEAENRAYSVPQEKRVMAVTDGV